VTIRDAVPAWITGRSSFGAITPVVSAGTASFSCSTTAAGVVNCSQTGGALAPGETVTVDVLVNRPLNDNNGAAFTNTATVGNTREGDPNSGNNLASSFVVIEPIADVQMTGKQITPATVRAGENASYVLSFKNNGPSPALNVTVDDSFVFPPLDSGLTVVSVTSSKSGSTCNIAAGSQITPLRRPSIAPSAPWPATRPRR